LRNAVRLRHRRLSACDFRPRRQDRRQGQGLTFPPRLHLKENSGIKSMARQPDDKTAAKSRSDDSALIRELALLLDETNLTEIEIERAGLRVRVARNISIAASLPPGAQPAAAAAPAIAAAPADVADIAK